MTPGWIFTAIAVVLVLAVVIVMENAPTDIELWDEEVEDKWYLDDLLYEDDEDEEVS